MLCEAVDTTSHREKSSRKVQLDAKTSYEALVTYEEVAKVVKTAVSPDAELLNHQIQPFSDEKLGFLAAHKRLVVNIRNSLQQLHFFVKTLPYDVPTQASYIEDKGVFRKEVEFFNVVVPKMLEKYRGEPWSPRCYLARKNLLVFEDARVRGFVSRPSKLLDEKSLLSAVACVARFHSCSLLAEELLDGKLNELFPEVVRESEFKRNDGQGYRWFTTAANLGISIAKDLGLDTGRMFEASERVFDVTEPSSNKSNVICQGDLWCSNLLYDAGDNCRIVDFQLLRYAHMTHDLMQMIYLTTTREYRERNLHKMLELYHQSLKDSLVKSGYKGVIPDFAEIQQGAEEQRLPALINAVLNIPTMMDGKIAAEVMGGLNDYEDYFFKDRRPFVDKIMAKDKQYEVRIKEVVRELAEVSLRLDGVPRPS